MATTPDISKLSRNELLKLAQDAAERAEAKREEEIKVLADAYAKKTVAAGFSIEEAIEALKPYLPTRGRGKSGSSGQVKFRDPANPANTYGGKGKRPGWLRAYIEAGRSLDEFAV